MLYEPRSDSYSSLPRFLRCTHHGAFSCPGKRNTASISSPLTCLWVSCGENGRGGGGGVKEGKEGERREKGGLKSLLIGHVAKVFTCPSSPVIGLLNSHWCSIPGYP